MYIIVCWLLHFCPPLTHPRRSSTLWMFLLACVYNLVTHASDTVVWLAPSDTSLSDSSHEEESGDETYNYWYILLCAVVVVQLLVAEAPLAALILLLE